MKKIAIIFAYTCLLCINFQSHSSAQSKSAIAGKALAQKTDALASSADLEDLMLLNALKHFKLSMQLAQGNAIVLPEGRTKKLNLFMFDTIKGMPLAIFFASMNRGREKDSYFDNALNQYCEREIQKCNKCKTQKECKKFQKEEEHCRREINSRDFDIFARDAGLADDYLEKAYKNWAKKNDPSKFAPLISKKPIKTIGDVLEAV